MKITILLLFVLALWISTERSSQQPNNDDDDDHSDHTHEPGGDDDGSDTSEAPEESRFLDAATATVTVELVAGAAFTATISGKNILGGTKVCHSVAVGRSCVIRNMGINTNFTIKYHCIPNTYINYQPVIAGNLKLQTWGTCWVPEYASFPDSAVVDATRVHQRRKRRVL